MRFIVSIYMFIIIMLFVFAAPRGADLNVIVADSTSSASIVLHENLGPDIRIDSVTLAVEKNGVIYVTRNKRAYGNFPREIYSFIVELFK